MTKLSSDQTKHIAKLCNLSLKPDEIEVLSKILEETVEYIKNLNEIDTDGVKETYQVTGKQNVFQADNEKSDSFTADQALHNARIKKNNLIGTKAVFNR